MFRAGAHRTNDPQQALDSFFRTPWQCYSDEDVSQLVDILKDNGMHDWARAPRLYFVLRGVGKQHLISAFLDRGIDDASLPIQESALKSIPLALSPAIISDFIRYQEQILKHEDAVYEGKITAYFPPVRDVEKHPLDDVDFRQISRLLRFCRNPDAAETPKLYYVLRTIQELDRLPLLRSMGYDDMWFPFPRSSLASSLFQNASSQRAFVLSQKHVCSSCWSEETHLNFLTEDHEYLDRRKELGSGGTGFVDHVWCSSLRKNYARKVIARTPEGLRLLANEIKMLKAVNHHHCVSLVGSYTDTRVIAMLSEPIADMNLGTFLDLTPMPTDRRDLLQTSFGCLSVALAYLHENGIRHKDIKPQNILIHVNTLLLTDFGLSADATSATTSLASNTPRYCSPEVDDGSRRDEASDVWSMGCVFYEIISVLRGSSTTALKEFFKKTGSRRSNFKDNPDAISSWLLADNGSTAALGQMAITATSLVSTMLSFEREGRPTSSSLVQSFSNDYVPSDVYNLCCKQRFLATAPKSSVSGDNTPHVLPYYPVIKESNKPNSSSTNLDSSADFHENTLEAQKRGSVPDLVQRSGSDIYLVADGEIKGHADSVRAVAFSPDGKQIASGSSDHTIRLWDSATGTAVRTLKGHSSSVIAVVFSPDGKQIASGSSDDTIRLWDSATGTAVRTLKGHSSSVTAVVFSPDGKQIASGSADQTIRLWDSATGTAVRTLKGHSSSVLAVAFSPDGKQIASGSADQTIRLWDSATGTAVRTLKGHSSSVLAVAFSPDGKQIASGSADQTIRLWDSATGTAVRTLKGHSDRVWAVAFSPDGKQIASGSYDHTIRLWDSATGTAVRTLKGHSSSVWAVAFSPDGKQIASGSFDHTIRLWDSATGTAVRTLKGHSDRVRAVAFSPDGKQIASGSYDHTIRLWDSATGTAVRTLKGHSSSVIAVAFSPDGKQIASGSADQTIRLWDSATLKGHSDPVIRPTFFKKIFR
ncbi:hypothetical protein MMC25_001160 [Agyrium rufum]|nr:hypothetical protein [Agyrium rufum]